jgi:hypothetical protein
MGQAMSAPRVDIPLGIGAPGDPAAAAPAAAAPTDAAADAATASEPTPISSAATVDGNTEAVQPSRGSIDSKSSVPEDAVAIAAEKVGNEMDADILFCNSDIDRPLDTEFIQLCCRRRRRPNVILILVTSGGDPDAAFRIARCLQDNYERFFLFVTGYCKSAGTLIALGAHGLIFGHHGELGPLDVQMSKADSLMETQSGLTVNAALTALQGKAYLAFEEFFLQTEHRSQGAITVKTAGDIALRLATGLFAPLYAQVDPFHVGEAARAMQIADQYGQRLVDIGANVDPDSLNHLATHYPSHGFVIDKREAESIFEDVREPTAAQAELAEAIGTHAYFPRSGLRNKILEYLNNQLDTPIRAATSRDETEKNDAKPNDESSAREAKQEGENK